MYCFSQAEEWLSFGIPRIPPLLFANGVVLLAPPSHKLKFSVDWFAADSEAPSIRINTSKPEKHGPRLGKDRMPLLGV